MRHVTVVPPDPAWSRSFETESKLLSQALGTNNVVAIHHIGSTAIPHIYAKPVIDVLVEVQAIAEVDTCNGAMAELGYAALGEYGLIGRRYFRKDNAQGDRTHHVHVFQAGSSEVSRHLAFRDYLMVHPDAAQQYSDLKRTLATHYPNDIDGYMDGKDAFVKTLEKQALIWAHLTSPAPDCLDSNPSGTTHPAQSVDG
ncbi:GrpB family protein [Nodosilinea sp. P-1105]|uniref:GrpB family protein n=1 Tax=Nodosilinea sp. P-1105 TaxID=2546229 RepID=UPI00146DF0D5|nr:GrpB family protein [Nodosilinea sp. P-1105]NMF85843.1 GrpB family protein [Nodosilinea sp. P-1105]